MRRHSKKMDERLLRIAVIIMIGFVISTALGAVLCNGIYGAKASELSVELKTFFSGVRENGVAGAGSFSNVFIKYFKYGIFIWVGGWLGYGIILSGAALCFRGISLGFTTSMLLQTYGFKGILAAALTILPQNLILIPMYLGLTWLAVCFWLRQKGGQSGKAGLRREKNRQYTEYGVILCGALFLTAFAAGIETAIIPLLMEGAAMFLV